MIRASICFSLCLAALTGAGTVQAQGWATNQGYPTKALREGREGTTKFEVVVNEQGRVESCRIVESSGSPDLDEATCLNVTRRASFKPALDADGKPTKGTFVSSMRWVIPK